MTEENKFKAYLQCRITDDDILKLIKEKLEKSASNSEAFDASLKILQEVSDYIQDFHCYLIHGNLKIGESND